MFGMHAISLLDLSVIVLCSGLTTSVNIVTIIIKRRDSS